MSALSGCLLEEAAAIAACATRLEEGPVEAALTLLLECSEAGAKLVTSGVGKSGIVARKIAATFASIGLTALYLHPLEALHGDLGVVAARDVVLLLSNSGETRELLAMLPHLRQRGSRCIALVGQVQSSLARQADVVLDGSVNREVCPLNLAPTTSTAVAMAIGDALAVVWMERQGISEQDFARNHPAGSLGRQLTLTAADLMVPVARLAPLAGDAPLGRVIAQLTSGGLGSCWVADGRQPEQLAGLITDGDLRRALQHHPVEAWSNLQARHLMTADPVTVAPELLAATALERMERNVRGQGLGVLPVVDGAGRLLGLLRLHDLVEAGLRPAAAAAGPAPAARVYPPPGGPGSPPGCEC